MNGLDKNALDRWLTTEPSWRTGEDDDFHELSFCPVCGDSSDRCQGHGEIGDPIGFAILAKHDADDHTECHPSGCEEADYQYQRRMREG